MSKSSDKYISRVWDDVYALLIKHDFERVEKYISHGFDVVKVLMESGSDLEYSGILNNKNVKQEIKNWCKAFDKADKLSKNLANQMSSKDNCGIIKHKI